MVLFRLFDFVTDVLNKSMDVNGGTVRTMSTVNPYLLYILDILCFFYVIAPWYHFSACDSTCDVTYLLSVSSHIRISRHLIPADSGPFPNFQISNLHPRMARTLFAALDSWTCLARKSAVVPLFVVLTELEPLTSPMWTVRSNQRNYQTSQKTLPCDCKVSSSNVSNTSISCVFVWIFAFFRGLNVHCVQYFHCVFFWLQHFCNT